MNICKLNHCHYFFGIKAFVKLVDKIVVFYRLWQIGEDSFNVVLRVKQLPSGWVQTRVNYFLAEKFRRHDDSSERLPDWSDGIKPHSLALLQIIPEPATQGHNPNSMHLVYSTFKKSICFRCKIFAFLTAVWRDVSIIKLVLRA
jgi:hypothetical protein